MRRVREARFRVAGERGSVELGGEEVEVGEGDFGGRREETKLGRAMAMRRGIE